MKVIIVHYRYFLAGGPERYLFNIMESLANHGHDVIPFSIEHNKNEKSDHSGYFVSAIGSGDEVYGHEYKKTLKNSLKVLFRMIYSFEAKRKLKKLISDSKPDLIYVLQFQNKLSCSVIDAAYNSRVPIVQRISDFAHICINNTFYNDSAICEKCLKGSGIDAVLDKCFENSYINSFIKEFALKIQYLRRTLKKIDTYVIPAQFTVKKFLELGVPEDKIEHIPTFFSADHLNQDISYEDFFLYVGRVEEEKGLFTLVKAFAETNIKLVIIGTSSHGFENTLYEYLKDRSHNIEFTGMLNFTQIKEYLKRCLCTICPSEWYDNFPNVILESYAFSKPVIASRLGSLTELVDDTFTGLHFTAGDHKDLIDKVEYLMQNRDMTIQMGSNAQNKLLTKYSKELHYSKLMQLFESTIDNYKRN